MSFSAYPIAGLVDELRAACERGVALRLILESAVESGGTLSSDASKPFAPLRGHANFYVWPHALRTAGASMHAKVAVADGSCALITSANLTERGVDSNLELGTYFEGNAIPAQIERGLDDLIARGTLVAVP
jgi:phosphatidylserine/phosphatidylglycerophosphate/cardiolipin synthase-like enzyme